MDYNGIITTKNYKAKLEDSIKYFKFTFMSSWNYKTLYIDNDLKNTIRNCYLAVWDSFKPLCLQCK